MSTRRLWVWVPALLLALACAMAAAWVWMAATRPAVDDVRPVEWGDAPFVATFVVFVAVGAAICAHQSRNAIGWVLLGGGLTQIAYVFAQEYAIRALVAGVPLPAGDIAAWVAYFISPLGFVAFPLFLLLFPTGRPVSPLWRWALWAVVVAALIVFAGALADFPRRGVGMLAAEADVGSEIGDALFLAAMGVLSAALLLAGVSLVVRYRRAAREERLQLKWVLYAAALVAGVQVLDSVGVLGQGEGVVVSAAAATAVATMPIAALIAVTRYRLYEIDRLISRTLTYALVTAVLVAVYVSAVTVLTWATAPVAGDSPVAVAAATLLAAAMFRPLRRRVQTEVDRRFNRARYDAAETIRGYRERLRNEVDLDAVQHGLISVVDTTMQPATAAVWLRPKGRITA